MRPRPGSAAAGEKEKSHPVSLREPDIRQAPPGDEPLLVHHHLHARIERPLAVQEHPARFRRQAAYDLSDQIGQARSLERDLNPPADGTGKGRKPDGFDDDLHTSPRPAPPAQAALAARRRRIVLNSTSPPMGQFRRPVWPVGPSVLSVPSILSVPSVLSVLSVPAYEGGHG